MPGSSVQARPALCRAEDTAKSRRGALINFVDHETRSGSRRCLGDCRHIFDLPDGPRRRNKTNRGSSPFGANGRIGRSYAPEHFERRFPLFLHGIGRVAAISSAAKARGTFG